MHSRNIWHVGQKILLKFQYIYSYLPNQKFDIHFIIFFSHVCLGEGFAYKPSYPELYQRTEKESELLIHFYVRNISSFYAKSDIHKRLYDSLQRYGDVKEISLQRVNNEVYDFGVGMKHDEAARHVIDNDKLQSFIASIERKEAKPFVEISLIFNFYLKNMSENHDSKKEGKYSASNHDSKRRSSDYKQADEDNQ